MVHLANGKTSTINAPNAAPNAPYVQGLKLNGGTWKKPWTSYSSFGQGTTLDFDLGTSANTSWGSAAKDAPPSDDTGQTPVFASATPASAIVQPGDTTTADVTVTNVSGSTQTVTWSAHPMNGLTVSPTQGSIKVKAGATATAPVKVTASADAEGQYSVGLDFSLDGGGALPSSSINVAVAKPGEVWPYYTNAGITDDGNTNAATFDGGGWSYSAQALAANGVTPGSTVTADGIDYTWPNVPVATLDNIEEAGQTIPLKVPSSATRIGLLGSATNAGSTGAGGTVTVHYTDGTTSTFDAVFSDWTLGGGDGTPVSGNVTAISAPYRNAGNNSRQDIKTYVFSLSAPLTAGKTVASITLPKASGGDAHVFAIGFDGTTTASSQSKMAVPHVAPAKPGHAQPGHAVPDPSKSKK